MDSQLTSTKSETPSGSMNSNTVLHPPQSPYRFTNDELRVLRQCNRESFYQRSLPLAAVLSVGAYYAVKSGYLKSHPRFGPTPKVIISAILGYFVGKFSYQSKCADKMMQLPNSPLGDMLRQRKRQGGYQEILSDPTSITWPHIEPTLSDVSRDYDADRPLTFDGLDDSLRPSLDSPAMEEDSLPPQTQHTTSYEELRQKNRDEYELKRTKVPPRNSPVSDDAVIHIQTSQDTERGLPQNWNKGKNKYGDDWEE